MHNGGVDTVDYNNPDVKHLRRVNFMMFLFAIIFMIGSILYIVGNALLIPGTLNYNLTQRGLIVYIAGVVLQAIASMIALVAHISDIIRSKRKNIDTPLNKLSLLTSLCWSIGFTLLAIGTGILLRAARTARVNDYSTLTNANFIKAADLTTAGLVISAVGVGIGSFGVVNSFLAHQTGIMMRVRRHPPPPYTVSHLRTWVAMGGNVDFVIAFIILSVGALAAVIVETPGYLRQANIISIIAGSFFVLGCIRTMFITFPPAVLLSDAFASPNIPADKQLVGNGPYEPGVKGVTSNGAQLPVVAQTGLPVGVAATGYNNGYNDHNVV